MADLFGNERLDSYTQHGHQAALFDHAAERAALESGRPLSQERLRLAGTDAAAAGPLLTPSPIDEAPPACGACGRPATRFADLGAGGTIYACDADAQATAEDAACGDVQGIAADCWWLLDEKAPAECQDPAAFPLCSCPNKCDDCDGHLTDAEIASTMDHADGVLHPLCRAARADGDGFTSAADLAMCCQDCGAAPSKPCAPTCAVAHEDCGPCADCGRPDDEPHTADCEEALRQDAGADLDVAAFLADDTARAVTYNEARRRRLAQTADLTEAALDEERIDRDADEEGL